MDPTLSPTNMVLLIVLIADKSVLNIEEIDSNLTEKSAFMVKWCESLIYRTVKKIAIRAIVAVKVYLFILIINDTINKIKIEFFLFLF